MTANELLTYTMYADEDEIWKTFSLNIKNKLMALKLPQVAYEELDRKMFNLPPHTGAVGYTKSCGYYKVTEGDRGHCSIDFITEEYEVAETEMLKRLASDIGYKCVFNQEKEIERKYVHMWRFYEVKDGYEQIGHRTRVISHLEENASWKYDTKYDYRKYWFELTLKILKETVADTNFKDEIIKYEKLLNHKFKEPFWKYSEKEMSFEPIQDSSLE